MTKKARAILFSRFSQIFPSLSPLQCMHLRLERETPMAHERRENKKKFIIFNALLFHALFFRENHVCGALSIYLLFGIHNAFLLLLRFCERTWGSWSQTLLMIIFCSSSVCDLFLSLSYAPKHRKCLIWTGENSFKIFWLRFLENVLQIGFWRINFQFNGRNLIPWSCFPFLHSLSIVSLAHSRGFFVEFPRATKCQITFRAFFQISFPLATSIAQSLFLDLVSSY